MKTIQPFIDLGWCTVPLKGELKRMSSGKKTTPKFPEDWNNKFREHKNTEATAIGGAITGKCSGIVAIDCDNTATFNLFRSLDPDYQWVFVSTGKKDGMGHELKAGTIIYQYHPNHGDSYKLHNAMLSLDFLADGGFTYLPTAGNNTKEPFTIPGEIKEMPPEVMALIQSLRPTKISTTEQVMKNKTYRNHLAPQLQRFVDTKKVTSELFKVITPKDFRDTPEYLEKGYMHPDDVPQGRGSEYLSKVSAIFGADESIDEELYIQAMKAVNSCFSQPMKTSQLDSTIIEPMVEERAQINGVSIWQYNEAWQEDKLTFITKRNAQVECFYDFDRLIYYVVDVVSEDVKTFYRDSDFFSYIDTVAVEPPSKKEAKAQLPLIKAVSSPAYNFGFFTNNANEQMFNAFKPTIPLSIFKNPGSYAKHYSRPNAILNYLQSFVPDNYMRNYLLRFLRRKLDKFEYSPTVLYFLGASGTGKDTFVNLVEKLIGSPSMARPTVREFLEMYNGWILDKYFAQLDEYGNQLGRFDEKEAALGKLKAYTGKPEVQIRQMRTDGFNYMHNVTFIMTANKNPLFFDHDDRRIALFNTPNILRLEDWVTETGGLAAVFAAMEAEVNDFAYYLATEVDNLSIDEYMTPPETEDKKILIASKFNAGQKIAFLLTSGMFVEFENLAKEFGALTVFDGIGEGRIYEEDLFDMYYEMTDGKGTKRGLTAAMKDFDKIPTTRNGAKCYYYNIPAIKGYRISAVDPIEPEDGGVNL